MSNQREYYRNEDGYTVVYSDGDVVVMNGRPSHPLGINQYIGNVNSRFSELDREHFGERIKESDVPDSVLQAVNERLE